jgi:transcriptional regulator with XRE-family HTH domain
MNEGRSIPRSASLHSQTALGLTQTELAARTGMTQPQLSQLESGGATPTVPLPARLARALDAELDISFRPATTAA